LIDRRRPGAEWEELLQGRVRRSPWVIWLMLVECIKGYAKLRPHFQAGGDFVKGWDGAG